MPIVIGPALRAVPFRLRGVVLFFFMAGLLLHFECAIHWELIASRRGSALSFHLRRGGSNLKDGLRLNTSIGNNRGGGGVYSGVGGTLDGRGVGGGHDGWLPVRYPGLGGSGGARCRGKSAA